MMLNPQYYGHRGRNRLRRARPRHCAQGQGRAGDQSRHRPAGFPAAQPMFSQPPKRRCATGPTAIPRRLAFRLCARRSRHVSANASRCRCTADEVVIVPGGKVTFYFACQLFGGPGSEILYPDPGFPPYREAIRSSGAQARSLSDPRREGFRLRCRRSAVADHAAHAAHHHQLAGQSDRRRGRQRAR